MPVTQYIGARYVPIIYQNPDDNSNNWKQGVAYEPLTIVSYAGGSYTSRSAVPAGAANPADAPEYWVAIGLYSGQTSINTNNISHIQHALANATEAGYTCTTARDEGDLVWIDGILYTCTAAVNVNDSYVEGINITQVLDVLKSLSDGLSNVASDLSDLDTDVNDGFIAVGNDITKLQGYNNFATRDVICISDSYGVVPNLSSSWIGCLQNLLGLPNERFHRDQYSGSGFIGINANTFETMLTNIASGMTADQKAAITDVIIGGGYNDAGAVKNNIHTWDEVKAAVNSCYAYARTTFPNAKIYTFMPGWVMDDPDMHAPLRGIIGLMQQGTAVTQRIAYIDGINWMHRQALVDATHFHPNAQCSLCIAESVASVLCGGSAFCNMAAAADTGYVSPTLAASASITDLVWTNVKQLYSDGMAFMKWERIAFKPVAAIADGGSCVIGTFTDGIMQGGDLFNGYSAVVNTVSTGKTATLLITDNKLLFCNLSGASIPANTDIKIMAGSISGPVML